MIRIVTGIYSRVAVNTKIHNAHAHTHTYTEKVIIFTMSAFHTLVTQLNQRIVITQ